MWRLAANALKKLNKKFKIEEANSDKNKLKRCVPSTLLFQHFLLTVMQYTFFFPPHPQSKVFLDWIKLVLLFAYFSFAYLMLICTYTHIASEILKIYSWREFSPAVRNSGH